MARNDVKKIFEQAKELIKKHHLFFIEDIISMLPISKPTFYDYFKVDSDEFNELKELIDIERVNMKVVIRAKLSKSGKAAELLALYKLICTDEERKALSMNYQEHSGKVALEPTKIKWGDQEINI